MITDSDLYYYTLLLCRLLLSLRSDYHSLSMIWIDSVRFQLLELLWSAMDDVAVVAVMVVMIRNSPRKEESYDPIRVTKHRYSVYDDTDAHSQ